LPDRCVGSSTPIRAHGLQPHKGAGPGSCRGLPQPTSRVGRGRANPETRSWRVPEQQLTTDSGAWSPASPWVWSPVTIIAEADIADSPLGPRRTLPVSKSSSTSRRAVATSSTPLWWKAANRITFLRGVVPWARPPPTRHRYIYTPPFMAGSPACPQHVYF